MKIWSIHRGLVAVVFGAIVWTITTTSAVAPISRATSGLRIGDVMTEMKRTNELSPSLRNESGSYTLVHFWAAYDAQSRSANVAYDSYFANKADGMIRFQAISLDTDSDVYSKTIELDSVIQANQYHLATERRGLIMAEYGLQSKLHSYLIDSKGVVVAVDPTLDSLEQYYQN